MLGVVTKGQNIPFREENTYKLELGMEYKAIPSEGTSTIVPSQTSPFRNTGSDFYLQIKLNLLQLLNDDFRIKIIDNYGRLVSSKKLKKPDQFVIDLGRSVEIKNGKASNKYRIEFVDDNKNTTSIILIEFTEEGNFLVNNILFGKI